MEPFPHHYVVTASADPGSDVALRADRLPVWLTAAPAEFGGPGDRWSPESMLVGAVSNCFVLTFRAIAAVSKMPWTSLEVRVRGTLDRKEHVTRFTAFTVDARLTVPSGVSQEQAERLLHRAEAQCLVTRSLASEVVLNTEVVTGQTVAVGP